MNRQTIIALHEISLFRPSRAPIVVPERALPISDDDVQAWVNEHRFVRADLKPEVARSLAYLDMHFAPSPLSPLGAHRNRPAQDARQDPARPGRGAA